MAKIKLSSIDLTFMFDIFEIVKLSVFYRKTILLIQ